MTLATAYWCVLIAAVLPYVWVYFAKAGGPNYNNRLPRAWVGKQADNYKVQRANAAHLNAFEAFAPFAAGVVLAQLAGVDPARIAMLAIAFVVFRILHGVLYLADVPLMRSLAWTAGFGCVVALLVMAALNAA
ncbi:MAG TPA: MAPEG family protein [Gammaproteobacteria bacterium]|nr:MAPEG family protein [Luteimonas sp.]HRO26592.1 MAPEG family protein [Luteimonas sp.]HRP35958.1 MAPEG family protein [Gammaproteobacteria bacterium]HRP72075.1 MAPEG family protein [Luteimonas sp.]